MMQTERNNTYPGAGKNLLEDCKAVQPVVIPPSLYRSPADRGSSDAYYSHGNGFCPNYRNEQGIRIDITDPNSPEWKQYADAFYANAEGFKDYGDPETYQSSIRDEP